MHVHEVWILQQHVAKLQNTKVWKCKWDVMQDMSLKSVLAWASLLDKEVKCVYGLQV